MNESAAHVGGMPLPEALLRAMNAGLWRPPRSSQVIQEVFGDDPDWPQFYDLATMARQNQSFQNKSETELAEEIPGSDRGVGVTPELAVLIGDLGADMPIALDYRSSRNDPRIIYLAPDGWREVAPNFEALCQRLGL